MRILVCSKRDLSAVVILNDLIPRLTELPGVSLSLMVAERTRPVETFVPELMRMKALERDLPFGVFFPLIEGRSANGPAVMRALAGIVDPNELSAALAATPAPAFPGKPLHTLDQLVERYRLPISIVRGIKDEAVLSGVDAFAPDLILSARFSFRFTDAFLAMARFGAINVHPGRLPDYAGLYPHFYTMLGGERCLGCTVHQIDEGIDSGPVVAAGEVPIVAGRSAFAHNLDSHLLGNRLALDVVKRLADGGQLAGRTFDGEPRQHTYPTGEEFRAFAMKGLTLIDLKEYAGILRRFGFLDELPSLPDGAELPRPGDSVRLASAQRGASK